MVSGRVLLTGVIMASLFATSGRESHAAEWSAEPSITLRGDYNSNLLLSAGAHENVWGLWESPGVKFSGSTETLQVSGRAAADFVQYFGGADNRLTNLYFPLSVQY